MKKILTTLLSCLVAVAASAQTANIEVSYVALKPNFTTGKSDVTNQYILLANAAESKFYSPRSEYIDSLNSTPDGKAKIQEIALAAVSSGNFDDIPKRDGSYYVTKSFTNGSLKHYDSNGMEKWLYEEPIAHWNWTVGDSTKTILGYECVKATTDYHGRHWTAWFAPEIPVQNGPWKLDGLPGLILEAVPDGGQYSFVATGIQQTDKAITPIYLAADYEHVTRFNYLKAYRSFLDNPLGQINAQFGGRGRVTVSSKDGEGLKYVPASVADFLETDYH